MILPGPATLPAIPLGASLLSAEVPLPRLQREHRQTGRNHRGNHDHHPANASRQGKPATHTGCRRIPHRGQQRRHPERDRDHDRQSHDPDERLQQNSLQMTIHTAPKRPKRVLRLSTCEKPRRNQASRPGLLSASAWAQNTADASRWSTSRPRLGPLGRFTCHGFCDHPTARVKPASFSVSLATADRSPCPSCFADVAPVRPDFRVGA